MATSYYGNNRAEHGQRRHHDKVSTSASTCIPMQLANMQASAPQAASGTPTESLRSDCWNSPLCPRNMPASSLTQGILPPSCGGGSSESTAHVRQSTTGERGSPTREVFIQSPAAAVAVTNASMAADASSEQGRSSMKRARTGDNSGLATEIKPELPDDASAEPSPQGLINTPQTTTPGHAAAAAAGSKEKRLPHHVIERRYRENLNSQIESLRAAVPSTSACLTLDMEDIGNTNASSAIRPLSKAAVIAHAAEYMKQLSAQNEEVERMNRELRVTVEALRRLVNCEDCGVVQQIVDAGA